MLNSPRKHTCFWTSVAPPDASVGPRNDPRMGFARLASMAIGSSPIARGFAMAQICTFKGRSPSDPRQAPRVTFFTRAPQGRPFEVPWVFWLIYYEVCESYIPHISICLYRVCHRSPMLRQCPLIAQPRCYLLILNIKIIKEIV